MKNLTINEDTYRTENIADYALTGDDKRRGTYIELYLDDIHTATMSGVIDVNKVEILNRDGERVIPQPAPPTVEEQLRQDLIFAQQEITDQELAQIEQGQQFTDLELLILGGNANV